MRLLIYCFIIEYIIKTKNKKETGCLVTLNFQLSPWVNASTMKTKAAQYLIPMAAAQRTNMLNSALCCRSSSNNT